jgi:hypothetical protein
MWESLVQSAGVGSRKRQAKKERWFESSHPDLRKGKPMGDGSRLEPGRALSLEGSTPSPSASVFLCARGRAAKASVFQTGQAGSTPAGHFAGRVAELVDAAVLKAVALRGVRVRLPPWPLSHFSFTYSRLPNGSDILYINETGFTLFYPCRKHSDAAHAVSSSHPPVVRRAFS